MRNLNYDESIKETAEELENLLKKQKSSLLRDRLRFLLFLKTGEASSQAQAGQKLNVSIRQSQRNWAMYAKGGLNLLLKEHKNTGQPKKLTDEQEAELQKDLQDDKIQFLHEAVEHIKNKYGKTYTVDGVHYLFKRLKIKKKTGRPTNIKQDKEGLDNFKKTILP